MRNDHYPRGTVQALMLTDLITANTRTVLKERINKESVASPAFFDAGLFKTLKAVCDVLIPQPDLNRYVDLPGSVDNFLSEGKGNGWRYDAMPADNDAFKKGLQAINETSLSKFNKDFYQLDSLQQEEILIEVQLGKVIEPAWNGISSTLFFEELLATLAEQYYSHPHAKEDIGEVAFADAKGWQKVSLDEREEWEPQKIKG